MGEREQEQLKTVSDLPIDKQLAEAAGLKPEEARVVHKTATGEEPTYVEQETLIAEEKLETGQVPQQESRHRLDELVKDFFMFSLAPVYLTCLWDRVKCTIKFDLVHRFFTEMKVVQIPRVIHYQSEIALFRGTDSVWDHFLQGLPRQNNWEFLFPRWAEQLVFVDREARPMQYWRVNSDTITIMSLSVAARPVEVGIFLPSGVDKRLGVQSRPDGTYEFIKLPPEEWVVEEAMRYFGEVDR